MENRISEQEAAIANPRKEERSLVMDALKEACKNFAMGVPQLRALRLKRPRAQGVYQAPEEMVERLETYAFYALRNLRGIVGSLENLNIIEIGPGDTLISGLSLLAAGAASYTVIERFAPDFSSAEAKERYREIEKAWPDFFPETPWPDYLKAENFPEGYPDRVKIWPIAIEEVKADRKYDVVCSYQVGEHVSDIEYFAQMNADLLAPGGVAVHRVDFGPHGCWSLYQDPLTFLRFPDWLWSMMGSNRGTPNRRRYHEFRAAWERAGLKVEVTGLELWPESVVRAARLGKRFKGMPLDSLVVGTAIFICRK
ncbi:MAG: methyltransferase domain-containing protein [Acidobacteria bacterium]|nr:methyltransferase domain-containing protein [Acidobacteriota bacterium]